MLLDLSRVDDVHAVGQEHAGMGDGEDLRHFVASGGNMDQVDLAVKLLGDGDAFVDAVSALVARGPADTDIDRKFAAAFLLDPVDDGEGKTAAVLKAAAPLILPVVYFGIQKLVEEPAVPGMDGHHAKSAELRISRCICKGLDRFFDDFFRHGRDKLSESVEPVDSSVYLIASRCARIGIRAAMLKLNGRHCSVSAYCGRQTIDRRQGRRIVEVEVVETPIAPLLLSGMAEPIFTVAAPPTALRSKNAMVSSMG